MQGDPSGVSAKLRLLVEEARKPFVGRDDEAYATVLALLSGEHLILIGEPGTAKSAMARRIASLLDARFFKYLLTRFTEPSELFGPLDINALREGVYRRITSRKLPEAEIAFLDEIFNANSAILNSLLTILQERILYDGYSEIEVPLWSLIAASNRIPEDPELEALYDRLLYRVYVKPVPEDNWEKLLWASWAIERGEHVAVKPIMSLKELKEAHRLSLNVDLTDIIKPLIRIISILEEQGIHLTDRRKGKILKAVSANAILYGRMKAVKSDLMVLRFIAPQTIEDFDKIEMILYEELRTPERIIGDLTEIMDNLLVLEERIDRAKSYDPELIDIYRTIKELRRKVASISRNVDDPRVQDMVDKIMDIIERVVEKVSTKMGM
ncbi:MAG: AAA family ATPase [Desulfurococcales archaeon]|nr:AAA family ATPase [Desulfurococcales archaeon]